jgi:hypothetical protein
MRRKLKFEVEFFRHRWPVFAFGFMPHGPEFILALWVVEFRLSLGY